MLTPKEIIKSHDNHLETSKSTPQKMAKEAVVSQFEQAMNAPLVKASIRDSARDLQPNQFHSKTVAAHKKKELTLSSSLEQQGDQDNQHYAANLPPQRLSQKTLPSQTVGSNDSSAVNKKEHNKNTETDVTSTHHTPQFEMTGTKQVEKAIKSNNIENRPPQVVAHQPEVPVIKEIENTIKHNNVENRPPQVATHRPEVPVIKEIENTIKHSNVESHQPQATAHHLEVAVTKEITKTQEHISSKAKPLTPDLSIPLKHSLNQAVDTKVIVHRVPSSELSTPVNESPLTPLNKQKQQALKHLEEGHVVNQATSQTNNTPGNIILANIKTNEPLNQQLHTLVNQIVERIQILVPNLANQGRVQLVVDQGQLKGTEVSISLKNNQLTVTLVHSNQNAELLQQLRPELLERLQKINTEHQVRIITSHHEQPAHGGQQEQGQQQESSQKSRVINEWLEEQSDA